MDYPKTLEGFFQRSGPFKDSLLELRQILSKSGLEEKLKWGMPVYCLNNKNIVGIAAFKHHFGLWFYQGVFLKDPKKVLSNAQEGKTKAMRHWKMSAQDEIDEAIILKYVAEAIANQKAGKVVKAAKPTQKKLLVEGLLKESLLGDAALKASFAGLSHAKRVEYAEYISSAKQEKTKLSRLEKAVPLIRAGKGLSALWGK